MDNRFTLIEFEDLGNLHLFKNEGRTSCCTVIHEGQHAKANEEFYKLDSLKTRNKVAALQNEGKEICGRCIATLYKDDDYKKLKKH